MTGDQLVLTHSPIYLKQELYVEDYDTIVWDKTRNMCAKEDLYYPHPKLQDALWWGLSDVARHVIGRQ